MFPLMNRPSKDALLIDAVRAEIRAGVEPLARDLVSVREAVERVERAQQAMYTKEVVDLKLKELRDDLDATKSNVSGLSNTVGGYWKQAFVTAALVLSPISTLIVLWPKVLGIFH